MKTSRQYWKDRELVNIQKMIKNDKQIAKQLKRYQLDAMNDIQKEIEAFYGRYATKEGINMAEARKRVAELDIKQYSRKAKRYVKERNFTELANEEMRLYNVTMKINRLELLRVIGCR